MTDRDYYSTEIVDAEQSAHDTATQISESVGSSTSSVDENVPRDKLADQPDSEDSATVEPPAADPLPEAAGSTKRRRRPKSDLPEAPREVTTKAPTGAQPAMSVSPTVVRQSAAPGMPPADPDDFFSPENTRLAQEIAPQAELVTFAVEVRKPPNDQMIRVHPDPAYSPVWPVIEFEEVIYLVAPLLAKRLRTDDRFESVIRMARLVFCSILNGPFFVWVTKVPEESTRANAMHKARDQCIAKAQEKYVRIAWSQSHKIHQAFQFQGQELPAPDWPVKPYSEILTIAFGADRMIRDENHPVIRKLAGLEA